MDEKIQCCSYPTRPSFEILDTDQATLYPSSNDWELFSSTLREEKAKRDYEIDQEVKRILGSGN